MAKKKRRRKESGNRASSIAGRILSLLRGLRAGMRLDTSDMYYVATVGELRTLCASVLSQDETKGKRK